MTGGAWQAQETGRHGGFKRNKQAQNKPSWRYVAMRHDKKKMSVGGEMMAAIWA